MFKDKKFLLKFVIFVAFWICYIIQICFNFSFWSLFFSLLVYLPVMLFMLFNKDSFALLILILFFIFYLIMDGIGFVGAIANKQLKVMTVIYVVIAFIYYVGLLVLSIRTLMNKPKIDNLYVIIISCAFMVVSIVNFFFDTISFVNVVLLIENMMFVAYTLVYFIFLEEKEREIFRS